MKNDTIRKIIRITLSVALVAAGICLMAACFTLYRNGGAEPYSPQSIARYWKPIAPVVYFAMAMVVVSFVAEAALPGETQKRKMEKNYPLMLQKLHEKQDLDGCGDKELVAAIRREQKIRNEHKWITGILLAVGFVAMLCYSLGGNVYTADPEETTAKIIRYALMMVVCFGVPFAYGIFFANLQKASIIREWQLMKLVAAPRNVPLKTVKQAPKFMAYLPYVGIALAVVLIVVGFMGDGHQGVLEKAVEICKECVGIG